MRKSPPPARFCQGRASPCLSFRGWYRRSGVGRQPRMVVIVPRGPFPRAPCALPRPMERDRNQPLHRDGIRPIAQLCSHLLRQHCQIMRTTLPFRTKPRWLWLRFSASVPKMPSKLAGYLPCRQFRFLRNSRRQVYHSSEFSEGLFDRPYPFALVVTIFVEADCNRNALLKYSN